MESRKTMRVKKEQAKRFKIEVAVYRGFLIFINGLSSCLIILLLGMHEGVIVEMRGLLLGVSVVVISLVTLVAAVERRWTKNYNSATYDGREFLNLLGFFISLCLVFIFLWFFLETVPSISEFKESLSAISPA